MLVMVVSWVVVRVSTVSIIAALNPKGNTFLQKDFTFMFKRLHVLVTKLPLRRVGGILARHPPRQEPFMARKQPNPPPPPRGRKPSAPPAPPPPRGHNVPPLAERLAEAAEHAAALQVRVAAAEAALEEAKKALLRCQRVTVPELLKELGAESITSRGVTFTMRGGLDCSIPKDKAPDAHAWLAEHGHGGLLRTEVVLTFGAGEHKLATHIAERLTKGPLAKHDAPVEVRNKIPAPTLKAWARERMEAGDKLPSDLFKLSAYDWADITTTKTGE
jgi:hypothetical protein